MAQERRILLLSCCQQKRSDPELLPALQRYNGPAFKVARKFLREHPQEAQSLRIFMLSAQFGLIPASQLIPNYDRRMTPDRANGLRPQVVAELAYELHKEQCSQLFVYGGTVYLSALHGYEQISQEHLDVAVAQGTPGCRLAQLHAWLRHDISAKPQDRKRFSRKRPLRIRGVEVTLSPEEVQRVARLALSSEQGDLTRYYSWYVEIDKKRVAPKWLVSRLTGLSERTFGTSEARRLLEQLGLEVHQQ